MDHARFQSRPETYVRSHRRLRKKETEIADEKYFDSYSHFYIHREMLSDEASSSDLTNNNFQIRPKLARPFLITY